MQTVSVPPPLERYTLPEVKHSGLGITSFVLSLVIGFALLAMIGLAGYREIQNPGGMDENAPETMVLGLLIMGALMLNVVGIALGIAGLVQKDRRRIFAVLGLVFNAMAILGTAALMILGSVAE